jgi:glycosyltransferase involved in cell wall biosynthesis
MVTRERFDDVRGFDEDLAIVGNDVDLCLRLGARGYRNIWTPHSVLVHHESVSRGPIAIGADEQKIWDRWADLLAKGDPYSNPNLDSTKSDCSIDWKRLAQRGAVDSDAMRPGINLIGYIRAEMGLGEAARGHAHALEQAGVPFTVVDYSAGNPARMGDDSWLHKATSEAPFATNVIHINADLIAGAIQAMPREIFRDRYTIGVWAWEMPEFPDEWLSAFDVVDEIWAPSAFIQEAVSRKSPVPVVRMPYAVSIPRGPFLPREDFGLAASRYQFLTMYDVNSIRERKNPDAVVRAFRAAFAPDDESVALAIKINGVTREGGPVEEWTEGYSNIRIVDRTLTRHEVDSLIAGSDCFVSLHRSEGFGLPIAEAMGLGKPVIATNWSGNVDFMTAKNAACIDYELITLDHDYGPYQAGQYWAEPDVEQGAGWMRRLVDSPSLGEDLGRAARSQVQALLAPAVVGSRIAQRLSYVRTMRANLRSVRRVVGGAGSPG